MENPLETFSDFYEEMHGRKMSLEEAESVEKAGLWDYFKKVMGVFAA